MLRASPVNTYKMASEALVYIPPERKDPCENLLTGGAMTQGSRLSSPGGETIAF